MTFGFGPASMPDGWSEAVLTNKEAEDCLIPMGITSENVASDFNISRQTQDEFAAASFQKAAAAQRAGRFKAEIVPITVKQVDAKTGTTREVVVDADDGIREGVTAQSLAKLRPAFTKTGSTHAGTWARRTKGCELTTVDQGNASQVSDGAAAVVLTRRSVAKRLGLPVVGKYVCAATVGVPPRIMGVGPLHAIPKVLARAGLRVEDVDFYEINEAFASQAAYSVQELGIAPDKVNVWGGAIALGHPLGCSELYAFRWMYVVLTCCSQLEHARSRLD